ncbi:MAG: DUF192 domain-containing protein [Methylobacillus sp.]|jgi:uncharacterized membrane protein (UPF0127 family)|nr:DUF192 domain-containing protein [Methylobacillus sp.]
MRLMTMLAACILGLILCAPAAAETITHPQSGLPVANLLITKPGANTGSGFRVEVAATPAQQERGLMFRTRMGANEGMIFPMEPPRPAAFWMKDTLIPLDIIFIGTDGRILNIVADAKPRDETPLYSAGDVSAVLEINGGGAARRGIKVGDEVRWDAP